MWGNHVGILVVDDCQPFRHVVCSLLHKNPLLEILAESDDGLEAIQHAQRLPPDLVLLDIGLPRLNGIEAARRIRELAPDSKILFLTQETDPEIIQEAVSLGALSYVVKSKAESELRNQSSCLVSNSSFVRKMSQCAAFQSPGIPTKIRHRALRKSTTPQLYQGASRNRDFGETAIQANDWSPCCVD